MHDNEKQHNKAPDENLREPVPVGVDADFFTQRVDAHEVGGAANSKDEGRGEDLERLEHVYFSRSAASSAVRRDQAA